MSLLTSEVADHEIFKNWKQSQGRSKLTNRLAYVSGKLFVWDPADVSVHAINVEHCIREKDSKSQAVLKLTPALLFDVDTIEPNPSCTLLCLSGKRGVAIAQLPPRWVNSTVETIEHVSIKNRLFLGEQYKLRQVKWHPGSPSDAHIVMLTSDECLRCLDALGTLVWKCVLSKHISIQSTIPNKQSIGETPVAFDFAPPPYDEDLLQIKWPILILWGQGDIYCVNTCFSKDKFAVGGPLRMFPPSDDNYGTDASSIVVLKTTPPIVVFSTPTGILYHSLLMSAEEPDHQNDKSLYVIEMVELDIGMSVGENEDNDVVVSDIVLKCDPIDMSRYFCLHDSGVHSVTIPIAARLFKFIKDQDAEFLPYYSESIVDYLVYTGLNAENDFKKSPILGCAFVDLSMTLFVQLHSGALMNMNLLSKSVNSVQSLVCERSSVDSDGLLNEIESMLEENGAKKLLPVIKLPNGNSATWADITTKSVQQCRKVLAVYENIAQMILDKSTALQTATGNLLADIEILTGELPKLQETAKAIAEKFEELNERGSTLTARVENIVRRTFDKDLPISQREKDSIELLENYETKSTWLENDLHMLRMNQKYLLDVTKGVAEKLDNKSFYLDDSRSKILRKELLSIKSDIEQVTKQLKQLMCTLEENDIYTFQT